MMYNPDEKELAESMRLSELQNILFPYTEFDLSLTEWGGLRITIPEDAPAEIWDAYNEWVPLKKKILEESRKQHEFWEGSFSLSRHS